MQLNDISKKYNLTLHVAQAAHVLTINNGHGDDQQKQQQQQQQQEEWKKYISNVYILEKITRKIK